MPKRTDIHSILIIGSGPIIIGQACEFDYSGTQACKALRALGYRIVLVNSNPATIMTDPATADATYIVPLDVDSVAEVIAKEKPDALLPNLGGQSGLNLCEALHKAGVLEQHSVRVIGVQVDAIEKGEDRIAFKESMEKLGIDMARSEPAYTVDEALAIAGRLGYPVVVRPAYTMGGAGGGLVKNAAELAEVGARGISASMVGQVLIEESILGWEELELEVVRDSTGHMITVCFIENIDPVGVHTGDSLCAAPMLTVPQTLQKRLQDAAYRIVQEIEVIGGTNVQFAHDPVSDRVVVIEINPRTSRSSALASKATGFPIAYVSALLAAGVTLSELPYWKGGTLADYTPTGDYVVVKFARWAFEKFKDSNDVLGTQMKAVGEVMSIGKTYREALHKAVRSLETGCYGLGQNAALSALPLDELLKLLDGTSSRRQFILYAALQKGADVEALHALTHIHRWFLQEMQALAQLETKLAAYRGKELPADLLAQAKRDGFADRYLAALLGCTEEKIEAAREAASICQRWEAIPVSGVADKLYYYSTYAPLAVGAAQTKSAPQKADAQTKPKIMILGGGPNRIGQGIEFDYCCVHATLELRRLGFSTIMVNCNPETVSTDYDTADTLYFEPLTTEDVLSIYRAEKPVGVVAQFGGQTPLNLAAQLERLGVRILGTQPDAIDLAEDRDRFGAVMHELGIPMPQGATAHTLEGALAAATQIGYPLMVRPSYVLGGQGMQIVREEPALREYMVAAIATQGLSEERPVLIDRFLEDALEVETDALSDGKHVYVPCVMEHIEQAGVHSGDSACVLPSVHISERHLATIRDYTKKTALALGVRGLMNMQLAIAGDTVYMLEANPRASRTAPLVSKVCNVPLVPLATRVLAAEARGEATDLPAPDLRLPPYYGVKEAVFPFNMFPEVDPVLGPEMRSTGEVLGLADDFGTAFFLAQQATKTPLPREGTVFLSLADADKAAAVPLAKAFAALGFRILATAGTQAMLTQNGVACMFCHKLSQGSPNLLDFIADGAVSLIINTPVGKQSALDDSYIRKAAVRAKIFYITTPAAADAAAQAIAAVRKKVPVLRSLQEYHAL